MLRLWMKMQKHFMILLLLVNFQTPEVVAMEDAVSQPELSSDMTFTVIGWNATLSCFSRNGSLPITYRFFRFNGSLTDVTVDDNTAGEYSFTVNNITDVGEYKCSAENNVTRTSNKKYSNGFNFTLLDVVSRPELSSNTTFTAIGCKVKLFCFSRNGSLPITYRFFRCNESVTTITVDDNKTAEYSFSINYINEVGEYKCSAENKATHPSKKYSNGLNFTLLDKVSRPKLDSNTPMTALGQNVTLRCFSDRGSLPINYSFFKDNDLLSYITRNKSVPAMLTVNLNSTQELGEYKCKAGNKLFNLEQSSEPFNFTIEATNTPSTGQIICFVLLLILLVVMCLVILLILLKCKARKHDSFTVSNATAAEQKTVLTTSQEASKDAEETTQQEVEYTTVFIADGRKVTEQDDSPVEYSDVLIKTENQDVNQCQDEERDEAGMAPTS